MRQDTRLQSSQYQGINVSFVFFLQIIVIGFASIKILVGHTFSSTQQTEHYIRNCLLSSFLTATNKANKEVLNNRS